MKKIIFGSGKMGMKALEQYGKENVAFFCDNSKAKWGTIIEGIGVISFDEMIRIHSDYEIIVTPVNNFSMIYQLDNNKIENYKVYVDQEETILNKGEGNERLFESQNHVLEEFSIKADRLDMLSEFAKFQKLTEEVRCISEQQNMILAHQGFNSEGRYYGNVQNILKYAELDIANIKFVPIVSHQDCYPLYSVGTQYRSSVIFPGSYFKQEIHKHFPYIPVFSIGPYIHYTKGIYSKEKIEILKKQNGRTLLVYMPHSIENINREFDKKKFIDDILCLYGKSFMKILMCVYWTDANDPICEYAGEKGMTVVSAGFRFDTKFNNRQKSLLELADAVLFGDIGTFISYALLLKKKVGRIEITNNSTISDREFTADDERRIQFNSEYKRYCQDFYNVFSSKISLNQKMYQWAEPLSGFKELKTPKEIREIISISEDIIEECEDRLDQYEKAVESVLLRYKNYDETRYDILKNAVDL